ICYFRLQGKTLLLPFMLFCFIGSAPYVGRRGAVFSPLPLTLRDNSSAHDVEVVCIVVNDLRSVDADATCVPILCNSKLLRFALNCGGHLQWRVLLGVFPVLLLLLVFYITAVD
ncbi:hypothetical protein L9F63_007622, partial [Diploptera punctata]